MSGVPTRQRDRAVDVDVERDAGLAAEVEPEARGDAAPLIGAERRLVMRMVLHRFQGGDQADGPVCGTIGRLRAFLGRILQAELQGVHAELMGQLVDHAFDAESRDRCAGRAIGGLLRSVDDDIPADRLHILQIVAGEGRHRRHIDRRAGEGAALKLELAFGSRDAARLGAAHLDPDRGTRGRAGGAEDVLPAHHHLHRPARFARQQKGHRLQEDRGLAAKSTPDLRGRDAELGDIHSQKLGADIANHVMALGADPELTLPVAADAG